MLKKINPWARLPARYSGPKSDHFDGYRFFNPTGFSLHGFKDFLAWQLNGQKEPWPRWIENTETPRLHLPLKPGQSAITFVNHATLLVQIPGFNILTDPIWSDRTSPLQWTGPKRVRAPGIEFDQLPKIDLVLISHNHYDHMDKNTIVRLQKKRRPLFIVALGDKELVQGFGAERVIELDWWQTHDVSSHLKVTFVPTQHFSGRFLNDRFLSLWGGYMLEAFGKKILFAGDAAYSKHFQSIYEKFGPTDIALLPIGAYLPRDFMRAAHMDPGEAVQAHLDLHSRQSIGIHFGTFQLTDESIMAPIQDLAEALADRNLDPAIFLAPAQGQTFLI